MSTLLKEAAQELQKEAGDGDGLFRTRVPGLIVMRSIRPTRPQCIMYRPALCLILQGAKELVTGESGTIFREGQSAIVTADVPTLVHVAEATVGKPFIGLGLELSLNGMREVIEQMPEPIRAREKSISNVLVEETNEFIGDCVVRLIRAAEHPGAIPILHSSIMREIYYWLLVGPNGGRIATQASVSGSAKRIAEVVHHLRTTFTRPIRVDRLAELAKMSPSSFFQHFKAVTALTPLQFQKHLRLAEARRLLVMDGISVAEAAYQVGYESASQFSREYSRMFHVSPARDTSFF